MKETIADFLAISSGSVVAVIGCGGKTSLIALIAEGSTGEKVLISTTTKMFPPAHALREGVECVGVLNPASGKLEALSEPALAGMMPRYAIVLLEADGSRGLSCKGWLANEPVIPGVCTHTVGVVTMDALGKAATKAVVHRLPEFLSLTGLREGEIITEQALKRMVCAPAGMFKNSVGRRFLLVNQVEGDAAARAARSFLRAVKEEYPDRFERLLYGSVHLDTWQEV